MSRTIHINLLKDAERRSGMPVRTRVMAPVFSSLVLLSTLIWWALLVAKNHELKAGAGDIASKLAELKERDTVVEELLRRERDAAEEIDQIKSYLRGRIVFGGVLEQLPAAVPATIQLTGLNIPPPFRPPAVKGPAADAGKQTANAAGAGRGKAGKEEEEKVFINMNGLADSADSTAVLRKAMRSGAFTNLVVDAEIPKGAFRISGTDEETFLFEISCECRGRRFE